MTIFNIIPTTRKVKSSGNIKVKFLIENLAKKEYSSIEEIKKAIDKVGYMYIPERREIIESPYDKGLPIYQYTPQFLLGRIKVKDS